MKKWLSMMAGAIFLAQAMAAVAAPHIHVLILDGESAAPYHNWKAVTPILKAELDETGLFDTDVITAPPAGGDFSNFHPEWNKYKVVVFNYDAPDDRWSSDLKSSFETYIRQGGGLVTVHAADNAFPHWKSFNEMTGIGGWRGRDENSGPYWHYKDGKLVSDDSPGRAGNHGLRIPFQVTVRDANHPIMKGLPKVWMHQGDELYSKLRGPGKMTVLATAYSDPANHGSGFDEPQLMVSKLGKGRIFHTTMGHDGLALSSVDFVVTFQRGVEWAATGKVTQPVPSTFPSANTVSYRTDLAAKDPNFSKGLNPLDAPVEPHPRRPAAGLPKGPQQ
ncbi:MAG: ThuA domain-containing protein [Chthonomonadales bacterium]